MAGILVIGFNGFALLSLLDTPLSGYSPKVHAIDRALRQLRTVMTAKAESIGSQMDELAMRFATVTKPPVPREKKNRPLSAATSKRTVVRPVSLPPLAGIVTRRDIQGRGPILPLAMLGGQMYTEGEKCGAFVVKEISDRGVLLAKGGRTWFVAAPAVAHSVTMR